MTPATSAPSPRQAHRDLPDPSHARPPVLTRLDADLLHPARLAGPHAWHPWALTRQPPADTQIRLVVPPGPNSDHHIELPAPVVDIYGHTHADLADVHVRRIVLPIWLETGPADSIADHLTFPQLHAEWPHLELTDELRACWEACIPPLGVEIRHAHPATGSAAL